MNLNEFMDNIGPNDEEEEKGEENEGMEAEEETGEETSADEPEEEF